jgi:hypothetical protein
MQVHRGEPWRRSDQMEPTGAGRRRSLRQRSLPTPTKSSVSRSPPPHRGACGLPVTVAARSACSWHNRALRHVLQRARNDGGGGRAGGGPCCSPASRGGPDALRTQHREAHRHERQRGWFGDSGGSDRKREAVRVAPGAPGPGVGARDEALEATDFPVNAMLLDRAAPET